MIKLLLVGLLTFPAYSQITEPLSESPSETKLQVGSVQLEWAPVEGASGYALQFISEDGEDVFKFESKTPEFKNQIPQGRYSFQIRSIDKDGPGPWSSPIKINVERIETLNLSPADKAILEFAKGQTEDYIKFEWMPVPHASYYYFMINGRDGYKKRVKTRETELSLPLKKGHTYTWKTIPIQKNGVIHETQGKPFDFYIRGDQLSIPLISNELPPQFQHIKWQKISGAQAYRLKIFRRPLLENTWKLITETRLPGEIYQVNEAFEPGEYKIEVQALSKWVRHSESDQKIFTVKPTLTSLAPPPPAD